jgi:hypothetical protein
MADFEINIKVNGVEQTVKTISQLETAIQQTQAELSGLEVGSREFKTLENQSRNLENIFNELSKDVSGFTKNVSKSAAATQKMASAIQDTAEATQNLSAEPIREVAQETQQFTSKASSARAELRKITQELYNLEPGSERFQELSLRAGELRDQMGDTSAIIGVVAGNAAERFGGALELSLTQGIVGLQGLQQGFQAAGIENEKLNGTLGILQGILGAASLIKFAGGLPDTIDQIKAGFASVIGPIRNYIAGLFSTTVATEGVTVATEGATLATRALSIAQKALPWVAVAAAVATVGYAIYDYVKSSDEASKQEEKRKKELEELNKLQKEQADFVGKNTVEFYKQIAALKQSNPQSKERINLIKEINNQYGTTLKNLSDENEFQAAVNKTVIEYIAFQRLRFKEQKNAEKLQASLAKEEELTQKLTEAKKEEEKARKRLEALGQFQAPADAPLKGASGEREGDLQRQTNAVNLLKIQLDAAKKSTESLGTSQTALAEEIDKLGFKTDNTGKKVVSSVNNQKSAYDQLTQRLLEWNKLIEDSEKELDEVRRKTAASETERQNFQLDITLAGIIKRYEADKKFIQENVKDKADANAKLKQLDDDKNKVFIIQTQITLERVKKLNADALKNDQEFLEQLKLGRKILEKEYTFGNQNTNDLILAQQSKLIEANIRALENQLATSENLEYEARKKINEAIIELKKEQIKNEFELAKIGAQTERDLQIAEIVKYYDQLGIINAKFNKETGKAEVTQDEEGRKARFASLEDQLEDEALLKKQELIQSGKSEADAVKESQDFIAGLRLTRQKEINDQFSITQIEAQEFLNKQVENLNKESQDKILVATADFASSQNDILAEATDAQAIFLENFINSKLNKLQEKIVEKSTLVLDGLKSITESLLSIAQTDLQIAEQKNAEEIDLLKARNDAEKELLAQRYKDGLISREAYNESVQAMDNQYDANRRTLENDLIKRQNEVGQKAFAIQKAFRISETIIAGIQGAFEAYASAAPYGALAPVVGSILAGLVAAQTAIAVRNIAKTKFQAQAQIPASPSGGSSVNLPQIGGGSNQFGGGGFTSFNTQNIGTPQQQTGQTENTQSSQSEQRVYVVESDITQTQRRVRVLEGQSTFN